MAVKLRLSRIGKKHIPFYSIVAVDERKKRDGAYLEDLGTYDAINNKMVRLNQERVDYWLSVGAVPTDAFKRIRKAFNKTSASSATSTPAPKKPKAAKAAPQESA